MEAWNDLERRFFRIGSVFFCILVLYVYIWHSSKEELLSSRFLLSIKKLESVLPMFPSRKMAFGDEMPSGCIGKEVRDGALKGRGRRGRHCRRRAQRRIVSKLWKHYLEIRTLMFNILFKKTSTCFFLYVRRRGSTGKEHRMKWATSNYLFTEMKYGQILSYCNSNVQAKISSGSTLAH